MAVVLDTDELPEADRAQAVRSAMAESFVESIIDAERCGDDGSARMDVWSFGTCSIFRSVLPAIQFVRTARHVSSHPAPKLSISVLQTGEGLFEQGKERRVIGTGQLHVVDENAPYDFHWTGRGTSTCLWVPLDQLGLPPDLIRDAGTRLQASPIYGLMVDHIVAMTARADELSADPAAAQLGTISVELARALLSSAAQDTRHRQDALSDTLLTQIRGYVRKHLADPGLTPEMIAAAHHISVRHLYKLCASADFSLHHWMTSQRLQGAREELAGYASRHRSIAMIAQRWGFSNPTHFSRRFRATYGMTPREWRHTAGHER